jgi:hypothetical protein
MQNSWCFHLSLNVASLPRAVEFYRALFGVEPAKCHDDYAKFEVEEPPVVFSLVPHAIGPDGGHGQIGLRLADQERLHQIRSRLIAHGIAVQSAGCGKSTYSVLDPDGNAWQLSVAEDLPDCSSTPAAEGERTPAAAGQPLLWEHYVTAPLPESIPHSDSTVDEIRLTGSFNGPPAPAQQSRLVREACRALKPGGKVVVHALAADQPLVEMPSLPGLAAMVSHVPTHHDIEAVLRQAGFVAIQLTRFPDRPWFQHQGVEMREVKLVARKPLSEDKGKLALIYRGPFRQVRDDEGNVYPRGQQVVVARSTGTMLRESPLAGQFVFLESSQAAKTCQHPPLC